jgi:hypothetical protein
MQNPEGCQHWWFTPVMLATQEAEIRRIMETAGQIVWEALSRKYPKQKNG